MPRLSLASACLAGGLLLSGCGGSGGGGGGGGQDFGPEHNVAAGDVDAGSVVLWAQAPTAGPVLFEVSTDASFVPVSGTGVATVTDPLLPVKTEILGLLPATQYHYRATAGTTVLGTGTFRTFPLPGPVSGNLVFGVGGDWRGDLAPYPSIRNAVDRDLDFFVNLGDSVYADVASPDVPVSQATTLAEFRAKHDEVYDPRSGLNTLGDLRDSTVFFSTIDDHEVIDDFAGAAHPSTDARFQPSSETFINDTTLFETGLQAFSEYNPIRDETYPAATGDLAVDGEIKLYRFRRYGDLAALIVLDTRSFRDEMLDDPNPLDSGSVATFRSESFTPGRTMLGSPQLQDVKDDLATAQAAGITWKFVMIPEPIQNLGAVAPADRYEGYAAERSELLGFIDANGIENVVFVAADIHGTVVNNLQYQVSSPSDPQIDLDVFEVTVPAVAYHKPLGEDAIDSLLLDPVTRAAYDAMDMDEKDAFFQGILDTALEDEGFDTTGLEGSTIPATLVSGSYVRAHAYGWGEFEVDATTRMLTVSIWGIESYSPSEAAGATDRIPALLTQFTVDAVGVVP